MNEPKATRHQRLRRRGRLVDLAAAALWLAAAAFTSAPLWVVAAAALAWELAVHPRELPMRVGGVAGAAALVLLTMTVAGRWWWLAAGAASAAVGVAAARLAPALLVRLAAARPIERRSLKAALREVASRSRMQVSDILEWRVGEGARATALVTGLGSRCQVFVASEVLHDWSDDEIAVIVAHELAHHVHHDLWRTLALNAVLLSFAFWSAEALRTPGVPAWSALPVVALVAGAVWVLTTPIRLAQSRAHERRADWFALNLTGEAEAFRAAVQRLSARHLAEQEPARLVRWFFHRHPPVAERLAMAQEFSGESSAARR